MTRTGHAFIKEKMREVDAVYGGEMSAHHYFRDFGYCDSGMIPWLLVCQLLSESGRPLSTWSMTGWRPIRSAARSTPRLMIRIRSSKRCRRQYGSGEMDLTDGLSIAFPEYRFNLRKSNTEPVLRLNVETRGDRELAGAEDRRSCWA